MSRNPFRKPIIMLLSLETNDSFYEATVRLLNTLKSRAELIEATSAEEALDHLESYSPKAILITDAALFKNEQDTEYLGVMSKLIKYIKAGGIAILMGEVHKLFDNDDMDDFFAQCGLPWHPSHFVRMKETYLNLQGPARANTKGLAACYAQQALFLRNVEVGDALYLQALYDEEGEICEPVGIALDPKQTPAAMGNVGKGSLAFFGDMNNSKETLDAIRAICGV